MTYTINGTPVGEIGFGMMSLTAPLPAPLPLDEAIQAIKTAIDSGCNFLNGAEFYGVPQYNSLTLIQEYLKKYPEHANKIVLSIKGAFDAKLGRPEGNKANVVRSIEDCLEMLGPGLGIAQFAPARKDPDLDFENETLATIDSYVQSGSIGALSLSEVGVDTLRQAAKKYTIGSLEIEFSLFRREPLTNGLLTACAELGIPVLAYSPLGKGFLGGRYQSVNDLGEGDLRRRFPQFSPENFEKNLEIVKKVEKIAKNKGCTPGQVAINWILGISKRPDMPKIIPIPGSSNPVRIKENSTIIDLSAQDMAEIDEALVNYVPSGDRYPANLMLHVDL